MDLANEDDDIFMIKADQGLSAVPASANSTASAISAKREVSRWRAPSLRRTRKCNPSWFPDLSVAEKINR